MNCLKLISEKLQYLKEKGIETSKLELRMLMEHVLQLAPHQSLLLSQELTPKQITKFSKLVEIRGQHKPIDKIIGKKGFYKYEFKVSEDVLSPRPDTETLLEKAIDLIKNKENISILELGVGSGCIIISLLAENINAHGVGIDISNKALKIAEENANNLKVYDRLKLINTSWFNDDIIKTIGKNFDIIISNPPYIKSSKIPLLDNEVKNFDPLIALDGGKDGLRDYRHISKISKNLLKNDGFLLFEIGENQAQDVINIGKQHNLNLFEIIKDLNNIDRCIILKK